MIMIISSFPEEESDVTMKRKKATTEQLLIKYESENK
jgi:hypothetical protein